MACNCRNSDGTLSEMCIGACFKDSIVYQEEQAKRDPLNGFAELILSQVDQRIRNKMILLEVTFGQEKLELYKTAFIDGIKQGIEISKTLNHNDDY